MLTIVHVSDLHFGPPYVPRVGEALRAAAETVGPDIIVASGDFTQRARPEQFAEARAWLDQLPDVPCLVVPGNHDVPLYRVLERILDPYRWYRHHIREELDYVFRMKGAVFVMLNSTSPLRAITNGRIDSGQLEFARRAFEDAGSEELRVVVAHHHFAPAPDYEGGQVMPRARRAIDAFTELEVDLILGGHLHRAYIGNSLDLYPGVDRTHGITIVQSGTSTSRRGRAREREKNSFNVIRVTDEVIRITHYMYFDDAEGFASVSRHIFPRSPVSFFRDTVTLDLMGGGS
jgi:3',5'-cyclic AMP phosphodiesterase CpdA